MKLRLERAWKKPTYTIGRLFVDGELFCNTLEDTDRGLHFKDSLGRIQSVKIPSETAIPTGNYRITLDILSPKYSANEWYMTVCGGRVPRLLNVPGFDGILIHTGGANGPLDTSGCILVGLNTAVGKLTSSKDTFKKLYAKMKVAHDRGEIIEIDIV